MARVPFAEAKRGSAGWCARSILRFLGVSSQRWGFTGEQRQAFSALLDRDALARKAYLGFGAAAYSPIKPSYSQGVSASSGAELDQEEQGALLDSLGFGERDSEGWRTLKGRAFSPGILVNADNPDRAAAAIGTVDALRRRLHDACGLPVTLRDTGRVEKSAFEAVARTALDDGAMIVNPRQASFEQVLAILEKVW